MEERTLGEQLRAYVHTDEPPLRLDLQETLAAGRRSRRRRRIGTVAAAAAGVVVIAVAAAVLPGDGPALSPAARCGKLEQNRESTMPLWLPRHEEPLRKPAEPSEHAVKRLTCVLREVLLPALPHGATLARPEKTGSGLVPAGAATEVWAVDLDGEPRYQLMVDVTDAKGTGSVSVTIGLSTKRSLAEKTRLCTDLGQSADRNCLVRKGSRGRR